MSTPRILIAEDEAPLASAVATALRGHGISCVVVHDGAEALAEIDRSRPDLLLLDLMLPGIDGFEIARRSQQPRQIPVVFVTARVEPEDRLRGFALGADDYILKPFVLAELVARVRAVLRRTGTTMPAQRLADLVVDEEGAIVLRGSRHVELTATELRLLGELIRNRGRVMSKSQLLTQVWGYDAFDANVVEVHISALRRKLEADDEPRLLHTVRGLGYVMRESTHA